MSIKSINLIHCDVVLVAAGAVKGHLVVVCVRVCARAGACCFGLLSSTDFVEGVGGLGFLCLVCSSSLGYASMSR